VCCKASALVIWAGRLFAPLATIGLQLATRASPRLRHNRGDEPITSSGNVDQIAIAVASVAQNTSQRCDMDRKIGRFDKHFRPHPSHEFLLVEQLAMAFDQCDQDIERPAAESERLSSFKQQPLRWNQVEWAKREARWPTVDSNRFR
jgi:hypothetical protein